MYGGMRWPHRSSPAPKARPCMTEPDGPIRHPSPGTGRSPRGAAIRCMDAVYHPAARVLGSPRYSLDPKKLRDAKRKARRRPMAQARAKARKVIITCAVTGSIHTPSMSEHLPITAAEIADAAIGAAEAGAAVVHLHARDPKDGRPDQSPEAFAPFLKVIKQRSDCVVNITTGGAPTMTVEERVR